MRRSRSARRSRSLAEKRFLRRVADNVFELVGEGKAVEKVGPGIAIAGLVRKPGKLPAIKLLPHLPPKVPAGRRARRQPLPIGLAGNLARRQRNEFGGWARPVEPVKRARAAFKLGQRHRPLAVLPAVVARLGDVGGGHPYAIDLFNDIDDKRQMPERFAMRTLVLQLFKNLLADGLRDAGGAGEGIFGGSAAARLPPVTPRATAGPSSNSANPAPRIVLKS